LRGRDIREAFKGDEYQILLVADGHGGILVKIGAIATYAEAIIAG
jgi:hypothetical protein